MPYKKKGQWYIKTAAAALVDNPERTAAAALADNPEKTAIKRNSYIRNGHIIVKKKKQPYKKKRKERTVIY